MLYSPAIILIHLKDFNVESLSLREYTFIPGRLIKTHKKNNLYFKTSIWDNKKKLNKHYKKRKKRLKKNFLQTANFNFSTTTTTRKIC